MTEHPNTIAMTWYDHEGNRHQITVKTKPTAQNFLETFRAFLYVCGFHPTTVADLLNDEHLPSL